MSLEAMEAELAEKAFQKLKEYTDAVAAVKDFKLERAYDDGFEAGVIAQAEGLGRV